MTLQTYRRIKFFYSGIMCVELDYIENFKIGDIYRLGEFKAIIKRIKLCDEYRSLGTTFLTLELL